MPLDSVWPQFHDLLVAYKSCRLHKPTSASQIRFETKLAENLVSLVKELHEGKYRPSPAKCFIVTHPKPREIFAADFRDRVIHHLVVSQLEPTWDRKFIQTSFACRVGKGSHGAIAYLRKRVRELSQGGRHNVFVLQLDIEKFFVSINRPILCGLLLEHVKHPRLRAIIQAIYAHDARVGVKKGGNPNLFHLIPSGKSWFDQRPEQGIPIGNLTSQFGANVYLTALDHFIQRTLKPAAYLRYMDDFLLVDRDADKLRAMTNPIDSWLQSHRQQRLNPDKTILRLLSAGIQYLGYELRQTDTPAQPLQVFAEPLKKWRLVEALRSLENHPRPAAKRSHTLSLHLRDTEVNRELASVNSRLGTLVHARSHQLRKKSLEKFVEHTTENNVLPTEFADRWCPFEVKKGYRAILLK